MFLEPRKIKPWIRIQIENFQSLGMTSLVDKLREFDLSKIISFSSVQNRDIILCSCLRPILKNKINSVAETDFSRLFVDCFPRACFLIHLRNKLN